MKKLNKILKSLMLLTVLIGIGFQTVSQNTITNFQVKQIRLLENQAITDSLKVVKLSRAIDTLNSIINLKDLRIKNCKKFQELQSKKIVFQDTLIQNRNAKIELSLQEKKVLKKQIRKRTFIIVGSAILNTIFIYKSIKQ